jgi:hypothetical protein
LSLRVGIALFALATQSCSLVFVEPLDPGAPPAEYPRCTDSSFAPMGDLIFATLSAITAASAAKEEAGVGVAFGLIATLFSGSAYAGIARTTRCAKARRRWKRQGAFRGFSTEPPKGGPAPGNQPFRGFALEPDAGPSTSPPDAGVEADAGGADR